MAYLERQREYIEANREVVAAQKAADKAARAAAREQRRQEKRAARQMLLDARAAARVRHHFAVYGETTEEERASSAERVRTWRARQKAKGAA